MGNHSSTAAARAPNDFNAVTAAAASAHLPPEELKYWTERAKGRLDGDSIVFLAQRFQQGVAMNPPGSRRHDVMVAGMSRLGFDLYMRSTGAFKGKFGGGGGGGQQHMRESGAAAAASSHSRIGKTPSAAATQAGVSSASRRSQQRHRSGSAAGASTASSRREVLVNGAAPTTSRSRSSSRTHSRTRTGVSSSSRRGVEDAKAAQEDGPAPSPSGAPVSASPMLDHLFRAFDADRDGVISFADFLTFHLAMGYNSEEGLAGLLFHAYDADGDGWLSLDDLMDVMTASTYAVGDLDVEHSPAVMSVVREEAERLMGFLDVYRTGYVKEAVLHCVGQRHPEVLEKLKYLL